VIDKGLEGGEQGDRRRPEPGAAGRTGRTYEPETAARTAARARAAGVRIRATMGAASAAHRPARRGAGSSPDAARSSRGSAGGAADPVPAADGRAGSRGSQAKFALPPDSIDRAVRRRGRTASTQAPAAPVSISEPFISAAGRDDAAHVRPAPGGPHRLPCAGRSPRCRRSITRRSWWRPSCPGGVRRHDGLRGHHAARAPVRPGAVARADDVGVELRELADHAPVHARSRQSTPPSKDVQAAINAASNLLPRTLPAPPTYSKSNPRRPADPHPVGGLGDLAARRGSMTSPTRCSPRRSRRWPAWGLVTIGGGQKPAVRVQVDPVAPPLAPISRSRTCALAIAAANVNQPKGNLDGARQDWAIATNDQLASAASFSPP